VLRDFAGTRIAARSSRRRRAPSSVALLWPSSPPCRCTRGSAHLANDFRHYSFPILPGPPDHQSEMIFELSSHRR
jgi:hypothetical protein